MIFSGTCLVCFFLDSWLSAIFCGGAVLILSCFLVLRLFPL